MISFKKYRFLIPLFAISFFGCKQKKIITNAVYIDSLTGLKNEFVIEGSGDGAGLTGDGPSLVEQTIRKEAPNGQLVYLSHQNTKYDGCIGRLSKWDIISYNSNGSYNTLMKEGDVVSLKSFDSTKKIILTTQYSIRKFIRPDWVDERDWPR